VKQILPIEGVAAERAGAQILAMASNRINRGILRELSRQPIAWINNQQAQVTPAGREMGFVGAIGESWAKKAPDGGIDPNSDEAEEAAAVLIRGWTSTIVHRLAFEPLTLTELGRALDTMSREDVAANVAAMRDVGLLEARPNDGEGAAFAVTDWLRHAIAPLAAAVRCERRWSADETPPVAPLDVEAAFLLTLPLLRLPVDLAGECRLVVELPESEERPAAGVMARVEDQRIAACSTDLAGSAAASAIGTDRAWLEALIEGMAEDLEFGGEETLARELVEALHCCLFRV
jgi:DNA-binding HxlR family transcriptional regulator